MPNIKKHFLVPGTKIGRLTLVESRKTPNGEKWICVCDCGKQTEVFRTNLTKKNTTSCGCFNREVAVERFTTHGCGGPDKTSEYRTWYAMKGRCHTETDQSYGRYGARGIYVSKSWRNSFEAFLADMGERPTPQHSIERIDNNGPYRKDNCYWATKTEQANNRRNNIVITRNGITKTLSEWCRELGLKYQTIRRRIKTMGWDAERALTAPKYG